MTVAVETIGRAIYGLGLRPHASGIAGSNPGVGMDVCLVRVLCVVRYRSLHWTDHPLQGSLKRMLCVFDCERKS